MSTEKGKSCNMSDNSRVTRIVTERTVKEECVCLLHCINSDKFILSNECHVIFRTSAE